LVDGGLVAIVPSAVARSMGADIVIAVDVNAEGATFLGPSRSVISILLQSMLVVQRTASLHQLEGADLVIGPRVGHIRWDELARADELIAAGYEAGTESIPGILALLEEASKGPTKWYRFRRRKKISTKRAMRLPG
jgi:NTE family protein